MVKVESAKFKLSDDASTVPEGKSQRGADIPPFSFSVTDHHIPGRPRLIHSYPHRPCSRRTSPTVNRYIMSAPGLSYQSSVAGTESRQSDALPHELIVSIQRILESHPGSRTDPLDDLSEDFTPANILNVYFPDGKSLWPTWRTQHTEVLCRTEASLSRLEAVQAQLAQNGRELQQQIVELQGKLRKEQDPNRMQMIQEMISVRPSLRTRPAVQEVTAMPILT